MSKVIKVTIDELDRAVKELRKYKEWVIKKQKIFTQRLAEYGLSQAQIQFNNIYFNEDDDTQLSIEQISDNKYTITASGTQVLFVEFGTGIIHSNPIHPKAIKLGMGAGTYPNSKGQWKNPNGWYFKVDKRPANLDVKIGKKGQMYAHTYGNPANMPMYYTSKEIELAALKIAKEVFRGD